MRQVLEELGRNIQTAGIRPRLKREDLVAAVGKSRSTIVAYEQGKTLPPVDVLMQIAEELDTPVCTLVGKPCANHGQLCGLIEEIESGQLPSAQGIVVGLLIRPQEDEGDTVPDGDV